MMFISKFKNYGVLFFLIPVLSVTGCSPFVVNLPPLNPILSQQDVYKPSINKFIIINKAREGELINNPFGTSFYPLISETSVNKKVEEDIENYLKIRTDISDQSSTSIRATIYKADIYREVGTAESLPFIGIFTLGVDKKFGMNLKIIFEIEQDGKVTKTYAYDEIITENGASDFPKDMEISYQKIFLKYRKIFYEDLDTNFFPRYF